MGAPYIIGLAGVPPRGGCVTLPPVSGVGAIESERNFRVLALLAFTATAIGLILYDGRTRR